MVCDFRENKKTQTLAFLHMYTDDVEEKGIFGTAFTVARVNHEFAGTRSRLGGVIVNKSSTDDMGDPTNTVYALDGKIGLGKKAQLSGFFARSKTPGFEGMDGGEMAMQIRAEYSWAGWLSFVGFTQQGEGFNPEVGFLQRTGFRKGEFLLFKTIRPKNDIFGLLEHRPHISWRGFWNFKGLLETSFLHIDNHWVLKSSAELHTGINITKEGVEEEFELSDSIRVSKGTYNNTEVQFVAFTNRSKPLSLSWRGVYGGFFAGTRRSNSLTLIARIGDKFNSEISGNRFNIDLPTGHFTTHIFRARFSYSFTPKIFVQSLIQYNQSSDTFSTNLRFAWLRNANSGLFVVFNEIRDDFRTDNRIFTIKYSHIFDVIR